MEQYINKSTLAEEIKKKINSTGDTNQWLCGKLEAYREICNLLDTLEVKEVDLMIHTIITECCDWLTICTDLSHDLIEDCRNLMLAVKDEQLKEQKGE